MIVCRGWGDGVELFGFLSYVSQSNLLWTKPLKLGNKILLDYLKIILASENLFKSKIDGFILIFGIKIGLSHLNHFHYFKTNIKVYFSGIFDKISEMPILAILNNSYLPCK